jgi:ABC-type Fe3+ transport system permease subunit
LRITLCLLVLLGVAVQAIVLASSWYDLAAMLRGDLGLDPVAIALIFSPAVFGFGGAALANRLHRRGSAWAWVVAGVPLALLGLFLGLAVLLWFNPITHQR